MAVSGCIHDVAAVPSGKQPPSAEQMRGFMGTRSGLDPLEKRKIAYPCQELSLDSSSVIEPIRSVYCVPV